MSLIEGVDNKEVPERQELTVLGKIYLSRLGRIPTLPSGNSSHPVSPINISYWDNLLN